MTAIRGDVFEPHDRLIDSVMILWRRGESTYDIAKRWGYPEVVIWRAVVRGRELARKHHSLFRGLE